MAGRALSEAFDERYDEGVLEELPVEDARGAGLTRALAAKPYALRGTVLTPDRKLDDGYVAVEDGKIASVGKTKPYGRADRVGKLTDAQSYEPQVAWGKQMLLDSSFAVGGGDGRPQLDAIRKKLLARFPQTGPIFA